MIDSWQLADPATEPSVGPGREPGRPTMVAAVLAAGLGWALVLPVVIAALVAVPFVAAHPGRVLHFSGSALAVPALVVGLWCVRIGPRIADRRTVRVGVALALAMAGAVFVVLTVAIGRWVGQGWLAYSPTLKDYLRDVCAIAGASGVLAAVLLATPSAGRDFSAAVPAVGDHRAGTTAGSVRTLAGIIATMLVTGALAAAQRR